MSRRTYSYWNWQLGAVVVIAALALLQFFRANRPPAASTQQGETAAVSRYTTGTIVDARVVVPAGDFVSYKMEFNRRTKIEGEFRTGDLKVRVECLVLDDGNFEKWKAGTEFKSVSATGFVPGGKIVRTVQPGTYHLVVSGRGGPGPAAEKSVRASFAAE